MFKVLLVDDEPIILQGLSMVIDWKQEGFEIVGTASNGVEALQMIRAENPDIVITDIKMPRMTGLELLERVKSKGTENSTISFIMLTGFDDFSYAREAIKYEAVDYLLKPVEKKDLLEALKKAVSIQKAIDRSRQTDSNLQKEVFFRSILSMINGKTDNETVNATKQYLGRLTGVRYISIELGENHNRNGEASDEEKRYMQKLLYSKCVDYVGDEFRCLFDVSLRGNNYDVGVIYSDELLTGGITEKEYLSSLKKSIEDSIDFPIIFINGRKVESIQEIADSCKTVAMANSIRDFKNDENEKENEQNWLNQGLNVDKKTIDDIVRAVERNKTDEIKSGVELLTDHFNDMDNRTVKMIINYLLFGLIQTAHELDSQIDQEEVLKYISESVYEEIGLESDSESLTRILTDFAEYLDELRSNNSASILKNIEEDIRENYKENLTLKDFGQKYFINASYLGQLFKTKYGISFKSFLHKIRIEKAEDMLLHTDMKMYSIAEAVGYKDTDYFINHFIAEKGCTPTKFRKKENNNADT